MKIRFLPGTNNGRIILSFCFLLAAPFLGQNFAGIGVALNKENGKFVVKQVVPGAPAALSGEIKVNDRIIAVAQDDKPAVTTDGLELNDVVQMIRGPKGSVVRLTIASGEKEKAPARIVSLVRGEIKGMTATATLEPGKPAPEIDGEDMDEKRFKLSDYRGKVVMLDFWGDW